MVTIPTTTFYFLLISTLLVPILAGVLGLIVIRYSKIHKNHRDVLNGVCLSRGCPKRIGEKK